MSFNLEEAKERMVQQVVAAMAVGPGQVKSILERVPSREDGSALAVAMHESIHQAFEDMPEGSGHHYQVSMNWTRKGHYVVVAVGRSADGNGQGAYFPGKG